MSILSLQLLMVVVFSSSDGRAEITNGRFSVEVNDYGCLTAVPPQGLDLGEGRGGLLLPGFAEWFALSYEGAQGPVEVVGLGSSRDWARRDPVQKLTFGASRGCAVAVTRSVEVEFRTTFRFEEPGDYLLVFTEIENLTDAPLRNLLFSREWRTTSGACWSYPEDMRPSRPLPQDICRILRMPDDLPPFSSQCITHYYRLHQDSHSRAVDVPLSLWTSASWPNGLTLFDTNGVSWGDYDADGWPDFFVADSAELWHNERGLDWRLAADLDSVLPAAGLRYGSSFGDYNNDGLPDLAVEPRNAGLDQNFHLLKNLGNATFVDVATDPAILDLVPCCNSETFCWVDVDADGDLDGFLPVYPFWAFGPGNYFLHNLGESLGEYRFHEASAEVGLDNPPPDSARPEGADFVDVDFDGDPDHYSGGTLFQNVSTNGAPKFRWMTEAASGIDFHQDFDEGCAFLDYDLDGDFDLAVAYCVGGHGLVIWESRGDGTFFNAGSIFDDPNAGMCLGLSKCDWDMDGDVDLTTKEVFRRNLLLETDTRRFSVATHTIPPAHVTSATPAWADWDKDGDLDCALGNYLDDGHFYENTLYGSGAPRRDLRVRVLADSDTVPEGLQTEYGAIVEIRVRGEEGIRKRRDFVTSAGGYLNQNDYTLHFALPPDPAPGDDSEDVHFDVVVDFPGSADSGLLRIDRLLNPELGDLNLADLIDREIVVYRSGKVVINGHPFLPLEGSSRALTTSAPLALPTDTAPLPDPLRSPASDWFVGIDFETDPLAPAQIVEEVIIDGSLTGRSADCGRGKFKLALWDVTIPASPFLIEEGSLWKRRESRNRRVYVPAEIHLEAGRHYRLIASVRELRGTKITAPVTSGAVTVHGGLSFQDIAPCSGAVEAALLDPTQVYAAIRFAPDPGPLWVDLGHSLPGSNGEPRLHGSGELQPGKTVTIKLTNALPATPTMLIAGLGNLFVPFRNGTLVPRVDVVLPVLSDAAGKWISSLPWPDGLSPGTSIYVQVWFIDPGASNGIAASNAISATTDF